MYSVSHIIDFAYRSRDVAFGFEFYSVNGNSLTSAEAHFIVNLAL